MASLTMVKKGKAKRIARQIPYHADPKWADIIPLPQDDGGPNPLSAIAYTEEYTDAMDYLRAVMAKDEHSERVLELTAHLVGMNAAHYTVWLYRAQTLFSLDSDLRAEIQWLNNIALLNLKNYQIWHHRQLLMERLGDPTGEREFIMEMFEEDSKNYHVWSYRQWLVRKYNLWDTEMPDVDELLRKDVRNNSAWNHRFFILFARDTPPSQETIDKEIEYIKTAIFQAPQNQSPWNYLRGVLGKARIPLSEIKEFAQQFAPLDSPDNVKSSHALDILAEIYAEEDGKKEDAIKALTLLADTYDPVRANYWNYRKTLIVAAAA